MSILNLEDQRTRPAWAAILALISAPQSATSRLQGVTSLEPRMFKRAATLPPSSSLPWPGLHRHGRRGRALVDARSRLGPRHRPEPVGRLRVRQAGRGLPRHRRPLLPGHEDRDPRRRGRAGAAAAEPLRPSTSATPRRPATGCSTRTRSTRRRDRATGRPAQRDRAKAERVRRHDARGRRQARAAARPRRQRRARRPLPRRDRDPHRRRLGAERDQRARAWRTTCWASSRARARRRGPPPRSRRRRSWRARTRSRRT